MGMAATQARLLTITARIHDVEYQAQSIQQAKIQLSTQQDQVYREYQDALDAETMTITMINPQSGETSRVAATFNNVFGRNRVRSATGNEYILRDQHGLVVVEDNIWAGYQDFLDSSSEDSPYAFAMFMMGCDMDADEFEDALLDCEYSVCEQNPEDEKLESLRTEILELLQTDADDYSNGRSMGNTNNIYDDAELMKEYKEKMNEYRSYLYGHYASNVMNQMNVYAGEQNIDLPEFDMDQFNYYVNMYKTIKACGGCTSIENFNGPNGDAKTDAEWLTAMIQSGLMTVDQIKTDKKGEVSIAGVSPSSDPNLEYAKSTEIDKAAMAKAEAKYKKALKDIDNKDKKFDLDLSKLDTERKALTAQHENLKKIITDNIDRTFKIFS